MLSTQQYAQAARNTGMQADQPKREGDLAYVIKEHEAVIAQLESRTESLHNRLNAVLTPPTPQPPMNEVAKLEVSKAPLAEQILQSTRKLMVILGDIETIHSRLQL
jgi:hypothetical protein